MSLGLPSAWAAETAARAETNSPTLNAIDFPAAELYAMPAATQALLDDSFVGIDEWLADEREASFAAQESAAFVMGNGLNKPKGFLDYPTIADAPHAWDQIGFILSGAAGAFAASNPADKPIDLVYALKPQFRANARFVMNRRTISAVWPSAISGAATLSSIGKARACCAILIRPSLMCYSTRPSAWAGACRISTPSR